jgi:hypothetical protein
LPAAFSSKDQVSPLALRYNNVAVVIPTQQFCDALGSERTRIEPASMTPDLNDTPGFSSEIRVPH